MYGTTIASYIVDKVVYVLRTLFLFTKSDIKTTVIPIVRGLGSRTKRSSDAVVEHRLSLQWQLHLYALSHVFPI